MTQLYVDEIFILLLVIHTGLFPTVSYYALVYFCSVQLGEDLV